MKIIIRGIAILSAVALAICAFFSLRNYIQIDLVSYSEGGMTIVRSGISDYMMAFILLVGVCAAAFLLLRSGKKMTLVICGLCVAFTTACALWWVYANPYPAVADQQIVFDTIRALADKNIEAIDKSYFEMYHQQAGIVMLLFPIYRIFDAQTVMLFRYINVVAAACTTLGIEWLTHELFRKNSVTIISGILTAVFFPIIMYATYVYGTLISLALTVNAFALLLNFLKKKKIVKVIVVALLLALARLTYSGALIANIAVAIVLALTAIIELAHKLKRNREEQNPLPVLLVGLVLVIMVPFLLNSILTNAFFSMTEISEENGIPASAWVLMGVTSSGVCGPGSYDATNTGLYSETNCDKSLTNRLAIEGIQEALHEYANGERSLTFFTEKIKCQWIDPWFGAATMTVYRWSATEISETFRSFLDSSAMLMIQTFLNAYHVVIYGMAFLTVIFLILESRKKWQSDIAIMQLLLPMYFLGGFVFYLFWESKSRYSLPYFVCLIPLGAYGIMYVAEFVKTKFSKNQLTEKM